MEHLLIFGAVCITTWFLFIYFWPRMVLYVYKRAILVKGFGNGPIPINTLYTQPQALFADPVHVSLPPGSSKLMSYGTNRDTLYVCGWLDLRTGPLILHVPDMAGRYYSVQFTDPSKNVNFAYVSKRTTGTEAGDFLISGPGWKGPVQRRMAQISSPNNSVAVIGRVFVANDGDLPIAYALARQLHFVPLAGQQSSTARDSDMRRLRWAIKMLPSGPAARRYRKLPQLWVSRCCKTPPPCHALTPPY
jgi:hypothetical protein